MESAGQFHNGDELFFGHRSAILLRPDRDFRLPDDGPPDEERAAAS